MKKICLTLILSLIPGSLMAQSAIDAYQLSQQDLRGTARFMSMGGAFGALGGDLSTISQNPAGIGVYRWNEIGATVDLQTTDSKSEGQGFSNSSNLTKFYLNNIGGIATFNLNSSACPNINFGFTYNKAASFARQYSGRIPNLKTSLSNYIAGIANTYNLSEADVKTTDNYDPYNPGGNTYVPWITVIGYDAYLIDPEQRQDRTNWYGQFGNGTTGSGAFDVWEKGGIDEFNIALGGNINNVVFWGMNFDITSIDYKISSQWEENLDNAYVYNPVNERTEQMQSDWRLQDLYRVNGTGFNYQLGVIVRPIQELRIGFAFHTPTYYNLTETYYNEEILYKYPFTKNVDSATTNGGVPTTSDINLQTPWKIIASVAGVIGNRFIISMDYEWNGYKNMKYSNPTYSYDYWDPWYDDYYDYGWWGAPKKASSDLTSPRLSYSDNPVQYTNDMIRTIYKNTSTIRVGAEYRITPNWSVRAGYNHTESPVTSEVKANMVSIPSSGTMTSYRLDNATNYITAGVGYKYKGFYADLAYVWKHQTSEYYPFSPDPEDPLSAANSKLTFNTNQVALSVGYKF